MCLLSLWFCLLRFSPISSMFCDSFFYLFYSVYYSSLCCFYSFTQIFHVHSFLGLCFASISVFKSWTIFFNFLKNAVWLFFWFSWVSLSDLLISNFVVFFSLFKWSFWFHFKGLFSLHEVMFKIILFFYLVRMIKSPSSVIFMLSYGLLVC